MNYFSGIIFRGYNDVPDHPSVYSDKRFDGYYGIQYTHSGRLMFGLNGEQPRVYNAPCAFISCPGETFYYAAPPNETRHHCYLCFSGPRVERFIESGLLAIDKENPVIPVVNSEHFYSTMLELQRILSAPSGTTLPRAVLMLEDLLLQLQEQPSVKSRVNVYCETQIQQLRKDILESPTGEWDFQREAERLSISYSHFRRIFKEITGCAPNQFLLECRLNSATSLLVNSVMSLSEIAHKTGFEDEFYFSRIFKKHRHITPSGYRKEFKNTYDAAVNPGGRDKSHRRHSCCPG